MKNTVTKAEFIEAFDRMGRGGNFSLAGREALYEYLLQIEEDLDMEMELDVIAFCCEYIEYEGLSDLIHDYPEIAEDLDEDLDEDFCWGAWEEALSVQTDVIQVDTGGLIIRAF